MIRTLLMVSFAAAAFGQSAENVMVVVNRASSLSRSIGDYYVLKRQIPLANVCRIRTSTEEDISRADYGQQIATPIAACLTKGNLQDKILYLVTTSEVPLRISGGGDPRTTDMAAVDSELTLLYEEMRGLTHALNGPVPNPFFGSKDIAFSHPRFPMYLVTRLTGYDFQDVKAIIDRSLKAMNRGKFVIDLKSSSNEQGNDWLRQAAKELPKERVVLDESERVLMGETDVIGYASWGSNDSNRKQRKLGFRWLPGAIMTEFVSTDGRTFRRPPEEWTLGNWNDQHTWFAGAPQTMTADYLQEGATGGSGHVGEPYLTFTPRPDLLLPAYYKGRNLAESYYLSIPALSWMNIVVGDPLCSLGKPER